MESNVDRTRRFFGLLEDIGTVWDMIAEDFEIHDHDIPDAEVFRGRAGFGQWILLWGEAWESASLVADEFSEHGDQVLAVATLRARGRGSGVEVTRRDGIVCTFREGKLVRLDYYGSKEEALAAAGLAADG